jgi:hypothetical protein
MHLILILKVADQQKMGRNTLIHQQLLRLLCLVTILTGSVFVNGALEADSNSGGPQPPTISTLSSSSSFGGKGGGALPQPKPLPPMLTSTTVTPFSADGKKPAEAGEQQSGGGGRPVVGDVVTQQLPTASSEVGQSLPQTDPVALVNKSKFYLTLIFVFQNINIFRA